MKKYLIMTLALSFMLIGCNKTDEETLDYEALYNEQLDLNEQLQETLNQDKITIEKLEMSLEDIGNITNEPFKDIASFEADLSEVEGSLNGLVKLYNDKFMNVTIGSAYGEAFACKVMDQYFSLDVEQFLEKVNEIPVGNVDEFCGHLIVALNSEYQYEHISSEQYEEFIETFNNLAVDETLDDKYKQFVFEILAHLNSGL